MGADRMSAFVRVTPLRPALRARHLPFQGRMAENHPSRSSREGGNPTLYRVGARIFERRMSIRSGHKREYFLFASAAVVLQYGMMMRARSCFSLSVMAISMASASCSEHADQNASENGYIDKPVTLYSHQANGILPGFATPGLEECDPNVAQRQISRVATMQMEELSRWHDRHLPLEGYRELERRNLLRLYETTFLPLPEADWSEGKGYTVQEQRRADSAIGFARQHNQAAFQTGEAQIRRLCPEVRLAHGPDMPFIPADY